MCKNTSYGLTESEIDHFQRRGFVIVKDALQHNVRDEWFHRGLQRLSRVKKIPENGIIELTHTKREYLHNIAPRAWKAVAQLLGGEERVLTPEIRDDFNLNTQSVSEADWLPPHKHTKGWHIDGDYFKRYLDSPEQGLLCLILWSRVGHKEGGTFLACDSIAKAAELMLQSSNGLSPQEFSTLYRDCSDFEEITGEAGDIVLCHPFLIHAPSPRTTENVRLLTNPTISLLEPMNFNREDPRDFSPVERAVLNGLGVDRLDYEHVGTREHFEAWRRSRAIDETRITA